MKDRSKRYLYSAIQAQNDEQHDYVAFWETIEQNSFLSQSSVLRRALNSYLEITYDYFELIKQGKQEESERIRERFTSEIVPSLIQKIEERYGELDKEIKDLEEELKIG